MTRAATFKPVVTMLLEDLVEDATDVHLAVENRDIEALNTFEPSRLIEQDRDKETALHYAAVNDDTDICKILISRNPNIIHMKDIENKTAYDWACEYNHEYNSHQTVCAFLKQFN